MSEYVASCSCGKRRAFYEEECVAPDITSRAFEVSTVSTADGLTHPSEQSVFWLLYTLVCHRYNGMYREYYGLPVKRESDPECLIAGCGAMQDVNLLECCVAYHERDLFFRFLVALFARIDYA
eukprot:s292_g26.t1